MGGTAKGWEWADDDKPVARRERRMKRVQKIDPRTHERLELCYSCVGSGKKTPGNGKDPCPRCTKNPGYEK